MRCLCATAIVLLLLVSGCAKPSEGIGPELYKLAPELAPYKPICDQFANHMLQGQMSEAHGLLASFTKPRIALADLQGAWDRYAGKPAQVDSFSVMIDPPSDDPITRGLHGIPETVAASTMKAEATITFEDSKGGHESFFATFVVVEEGGRLAIAGPYFED